MAESSQDTLRKADELREKLLLQDRQLTAAVHKQLFEETRRLGQEQKGIAQSIRSLLVKWERFSRTNGSKIPTVTVMKIRLRQRALQASMKALLNGIGSRELSELDFDQGTVNVNRILSNAGQTNTPPQLGNQPTPSKFPSAKLFRIGSGDVREQD